MSVKATEFRGYRPNGDASAAEFKPSALGVPSHWQSLKLKHVADVRFSSVDKHTVERETPVRLCNYVDVYKNERITESLEFMKATATPEEVRRFALELGDVLVTKDSESWTDIGVPALVAETLDGVLCGYHLALIRPKAPMLSGAFLARALASRGIADQLYVRAAGVTRFGLSVDAIGSMLIPIPPINEQELIVDWIGRKAARIDALLRKKQEFIDLLEAQRAGVITSAVLRGLDTGVRRCESGIAWMGAVPCHWRVKRTKYVARLESGHTPSRQIDEYWRQCTIPWFGLADVWQIRHGRKEFVSETEECISELGLANSAARLLPAGTVILSRTASVGFSAIMDVPMATTQDFVNWVCGPSIRPEYLLYVFRAMMPEFRRLTMGSTHQTIYMPDVGQFMTPLPPLDEQDRIVDHIRRETSRIDALVDRIRAGIARLKEYRTALITAAVTGQIDLRGEAAA